MLIFGFRVFRRSLVEVLRSEIWDLGFPKAGVQMLRDECSGLEEVTPLLESM